MTRLQFRVLYREFLFRMVDLEILSAHAKGDISKLLGQFAALLLFVSMLFAITVAHLNPYMTAMERLEYLWTMEHLFVATTMLAVGLFAVLSWDSTFLDRIDVLVLAPLPVKAATLIWAKLAGLATALAVTVAMLNALSGLLWPVALVPDNSGVLGPIRSFFAYWMTMLSAGAFVVCSVLTVQGLAAQLPRRYFLRLSGFLQMAGFCLFLTVYVLEPSLTTPRAFTAIESQRALIWLPTYWFFGLFQELNGSPHPALHCLASRALTGLAVASCGAASVFLLSYFRTLRKIVEESDIAPNSRARWPILLGNSLKAAVLLFSMRSLARSRQHRLLLAFYLGVGFTFVVLSTRAPGAQQQLSTQSGSLLFASLVMMCACIAGTRVAFALPLNLRANWVFRLTEVRGSQVYLAAIRLSLFVLGIAPVVLTTSAALLYLWPWRIAIGHIVLLSLWGITIAYLCLLGFRKMPFACSYLPGRSNVHMVFLGALGLFQAIVKIVELERGALGNPNTYAKMFATLLVAAFSLRWSVIALGSSEDLPIQLEAEESGGVQALGLNRDGTTPVH